jgi:hypothetical protein
MSWNLGIWSLDNIPCGAASSNVGCAYAWFCSRNLIATNLHIVEHLRYEALNGRSLQNVLSTWPLVRVAVEHVFHQLLEEGRVRACDAWNGTFDYLLNEPWDILSIKRHLQHTQLVRDTSHRPDI